MNSSHKRRHGSGFAAVAARLLLPRISDPKQAGFSRKAGFP